MLIDDRVRNKLYDTYALINLMSKAIVLLVALDMENMLERWIGSDKLLRMLADEVFDEYQ